jgi:hypothetical protein
MLNRNCKKWIHNFVFSPIFVIHVNVCASLHSNNKIQILYQALSNFFLESICTSTMNTKNEDIEQKMTLRSSQSTQENNMHKHMHEIQHHAWTKAWEEQHMGPNAPGEVTPCIFLKAPKTKNIYFYVFRNNDTFLTCFKYILKIFSKWNMNTLFIFK